MITLNSVVQLSTLNLEDANCVIKLLQNEVRPRGRLDVGHQLDQKRILDLVFLKNKLEREEIEREETPLKQYLCTLQTGTLLKIKGCRDRNGLRRLIKPYTGIGPLICRQVTMKTPAALMIDANCITTHMINKVTHVQVAGVFVKIKTLL